MASIMGYMYVWGWDERKIDNKFSFDSKEKIPIYLIYRVAQKECNTYDQIISRKLGTE